MGNPVWNEVEYHEQNSWDVCTVNKMKALSFKWKQQLHNFPLWNRWNFTKIDIQGSHRKNIWVILSSYLKWKCYWVAKVHCRIINRVWFCLNLSSMHYFLKFWLAPNNNDAKYTEFWEFRVITEPPQIHLVNLSGFFPLEIYPLISG